MKLFTFFTLCVLLLAFFTTGALSAAETKSEKKTDKKMQSDKKDLDKEQKEIEKELKAQEGAATLNRASYMSLAAILALNQAI